MLGLMKPICYAEIIELLITQWASYIRQQKYPKVYRKQSQSRIIIIHTPALLYAGLIIV